MSEYPFMLGAIVVLYIALRLEYRRERKQAHDTKY